MITPRDMKDRPHWISTISSKEQSNLNLGEYLSWDWFILLAAKTGMRFSEALAITPDNFDFSRQTLSISKTWDYKGDGGYLSTKERGIAVELFVRKNKIERLYFEII